MISSNYSAEKTSDPESSWPQNQSPSRLHSLNPFRSGGGVASFESPQVVQVKVIPTRTFWVLLFLAVPLNAIMFSLGYGWFFYVYNLLLLSISLISTRLAPDRTDFLITRRMDAALSVRTANRVEITLENIGSEAIVGKLRDEAPLSFPDPNQQFSLNIESGRQETFTYDVIPSERGPERFPGTFLRVRCPLNLVEKQLFLDTRQEIRVYPNILALRQFNLLNQHGRLREVGIRQSRMRGIGTEFESLREYGEGDDFRKIDWKATARRNKMMVRQFEVERNQSVILCVDCGRHMLSEVSGVRKLDHVLDAILLLSNAASAAGDQVGLLVYAEKVVKFIPPKKGRGHLGLIIEGLHDLTAKPIESDPVVAFDYLAKRNKKRSLIINFTATEDKDRATDVVRSFCPLSRQHIALLVNVTDPRIRELLHSDLETVEDLALQRAAQWVIQDRAEAEAVIGATGIHRLYSEPQDLGKALVNYYLDVKARAIL